MHILTVAQNKGGEGKTSVTRWLADFAVKRGLRVLLIDVDSQCNLSQRYLKMEVDPTEADAMLPPVHPAFDPADTTWDGRSSVVDIFKEGGFEPYPTDNPMIDILPGLSGAMRKLEMQSEENLRERIYDRMHISLSDPSVQAVYDLILIDTPPTKSALVISAVRAATHMLIPCQMEQQSIEGLRGMIQMWRRELRTVGNERSIELIGVLVNKYRSSVALQVGTLASLRANPALQSLLVPHLISLRAVFAEQDHPNARPKCVFDLPANDKARQEAEAACQWIFAKAGIESVKREAVA